MAKKTSSRKTSRKAKPASPSRGKAARKVTAKKPPRPPAKKRPAAKPQSAPKVAARKKPAASFADELRKLDTEILKLVNRRAQVTTRHLQQLKDPQNGVYAPREDDELWTKLEDANKGPLPASAVRSIFREILSSARREVKTQRVSYLGPRFSFTHLAAIERFGKHADLIPVSTIASVFEEVNRGHADYGVVPIENSTDGRIVDTLDMFTRLPLRICGEVQISVHHNLLARCPRGEVVEIYSKPQALSQCRDWLGKNMPQARLIEVTSTSTAAQLARDKHGAAAVASQQAAIEYDLHVLAQDIQDNKNNVTRFAVIGHDSSPPSGKDRTSLLLQISHRPGALSDALVTFKKNKVNLTWIESFPLRGPEAGYLFFLDFEGHSNDAKIKRALEELQKSAVRLEVLGSYPRSEPRD